MCVCVWFCLPLSDLLNECLQCGLSGADPSFGGPETCKIWGPTLRKRIQN